MIVRIDGDAVRGVELARPSSGLAPRHQPVALLIYFGNSRIDVAVANVGVPGGVPGNVGHLAKHAVDRRQRRPHMLQRLGTLV